MEKATEGRAATLNGETVAAARPQTVLEVINEAIESHNREIARLMQMRKDAHNYGIANVPQRVLGEMVFPQHPY